MLTRRSVRRFEDKKVPRELLETVVKAGIFAPTANHIETHRFTVVTDDKILASLVSAIAAATGKGAGYSFYDPAAFVMASDARDNHNGLANCACALENMMLASHALGLGSVWINQFKLVCDDSAVRALLRSLEVPDDHIVWGCLSIGYPAEESAEHCKDESAVRWF